MGWIIPTVIVTIVVLALVDLVIQLFFVRVILRFFEHRPQLNPGKFEPDPAAERVEFETDDGVRIVGSLHGHPEGTSPGVIVFCPEFGGTHWSASYYCESLLNAGYRVLAFDFCGHGESGTRPGYENPQHWITRYELADTLAAIRFTRTHPELRELPLGLFGISRGGGAALAAGGLTPDVRAVVTDSGFATVSMMVHFARRWAVLFLPVWLVENIPTWHLVWTLKMVLWYSGRKHGCRFVPIERLSSRLRKRPVLMIVGRRDNYVPAEVVDRMASAIGPHVEKVVVKGAKHNQARSVDPEAYDELLLKGFSALSAADGTKPIRAVG